MPLANKARGTNNILSNRKVVDMRDAIAYLEPLEYPLTTLLKRLKGRKRTTHSYKFEWLEKDPMGRWAKFSGTTETSPGTTVEVATGEGSLFQAGDLVKNTATDEIVRVTGIDGDTLTVARGYGETNAANITADDKLLVVGNASMQGAGSPSEKYKNASPVHNYTQIFRTAFSTTETLNKMKLYGGDELSNLRKEKAVEHARDMEFSFWFGERKLDTSGAQPLTTTAGVYTFLKDLGAPFVNSLSGSSMTEAQFDEWVGNIFRYGSKEKALFCGQALIDIIQTFAKNKLQLIQKDKDKTYGLNITRYLTAHGTLDIMRHYLFEEGYANLNVALDMKNLRYVSLEGRDTKLLPNRQRNDEDGQKEEYLTEAGIELLSPKTHGVLLLT